MSTISNNLKSIKSSLPDSVKLVAVSKTKPIEAIQEAYDKGQLVFGENRAQEMAEKHEVLPKDIEWHMIGHLQSNKVKYIASFVDFIHSIDKLKLAKEVNKRAEIANRTINILLQIHIAEEDQKFGFDRDELLDLLKNKTIQQYNSIKIRGLMGMATNTDDKEKVRGEFRKLKQLFDEVKNQFFKENDSFDTLSMGMSGDYTLAIEEGSNLVRIGSLIFGSRN